MDELWERRRAGARNLAGTTYQTEVAAFLLVKAMRGELLFSELVPEGLEDIDCHDQDGTRLLVQAKEVTGSNFTVGQLADALAHAVEGLRSHDKVAIVTNAALENRLTAGDWERPLAGILTQGAIEAIRDALVERAVEDPFALLERAYLVRLRVEHFSELPHELAESFEVPPEIGGLIHSEFLVGLGSAAAEQRLRSRAGARRWTLSEAEEVAVRVVASVNRDAVNEAVRRGVAEPVGFHVRSSLVPEEFLSGVNVSPAHIAADLDVPRPDLLDAILAGLADDRHVAIVGPSGSGKSAALWRVARELSGTTRLVRARRVDGPEDVETLLHYVRLLRPERQRPVAVCCDDVGRPGTSAWATAVRLLLEIPGVAVLSAAREEDLTAAALGGDCRITRPALDGHTAERIHTTLRSRGSAIALGFEEAWARSGGLLLEFVSLATGGERLARVVGAQAEERLGPGRELEFDALRLVCTAHLAGAPMPGGVLAALLGASGGAYRSALVRLRDEHVLLEDEAGRWTGLHELRSEVIVAVLHRIPPPALGDTLTTLIRGGPPEMAAAALIFTARRLGNVPASSVVALRHRLVNATGDEAAILIEAAVVADAAVNAAVYLELARRADLPHLDLWTRVHLAMGSRVVEGLTSMLPAEITRLGSQLPALDRRVLDACWEASQERGVSEFVTGMWVDRALRVLNALETAQSTEKIREGEIRELIKNLTDGRERGHDLAAACQQLAASSSETIVSIFGSLDDRVTAVGRRLENCCGYWLESTSDELVVGVELMILLDSDDAHERAVAACKLLREVCPEADIFAARTVWPGGAAFASGGHGIADKRIPRDALPRRATVRLRAAVLDEVMRSSRARFWTDWIRTLGRLSRTARLLVEQSVIRVLNRGDSSTQRGRWSADVRGLLREVALLPHSPEGDDTAGSLRLPGQLLGDIATALLHLDRDVLPSQDGGALGRVGWQLRNACAKFHEAASAGYPRLADEPTPLPEDLLDACALIADLLLALRCRPGLLVRRQTGESWSGAARRFVLETQGAEVEEEERALRALLDSVAPDARLERMPRTAWASPRLVTDIWLVCPDLASGTELGPALETLTRASGGRFEGRIFVVYPTEEVLLPIGQMLIQTWHPLPQEELREVASHLRLRWPDGPARRASLLIFESLLRASSEAWLGFRREALFGEPTRTQRLVENARDALRNARPALGDELADGFASLVDQVAEEVKSESAEPLAVTLAKGELPEMLSLLLNPVFYDEIRKGSDGSPEPE